MILVRVLGGLEVEVDGAARGSLADRRARALLAWLAVHPGLHDRSTVAGRLRPEVPEDAARKGLRQAAWALRAWLGPAGAAGLVATRDRLGLAGVEQVRVDLAECGRLHAADRLEEALALCAGDLLAGLDEEWIHPLREGHRAATATLAATLADRAEAAGELPGAVRWSRRRAELEPLAEEAHRALMRRLALAGDRPAALAVLAALDERLRRELRMVPSAATRALAEGIRRGTMGPSAAAETQAAATRLPPALADRRPPLGREGELARLVAVWAAARAGRLELACVAGEAGIGKTTLAAALGAHAHAGGADVLYGRSDEDAVVPYAPWVEALTRHLECLAPDAREAALAAAGASLARLLPGVDVEAPRAEPAGEAATGRYRSFEAVRALLEHQARARPLLVVLDDLHWADEGSLLLVRHLARMAGPVPVALVATYRDTEVDRRHRLARLVGDLRRERALAEVVLPGLPEAAVVALAARAGAPAGGREAGALRARTGGNPFFIEEVLRHRLESADDPGADPPAPEVVPPGVTDVVSQRLDRLGEEAVAVLGTASLLGGGIDAALLGRLCGEEPAAEALEAAGQAGLLAPAGRAVHPTFRHALIAETLQGSMTRPRRLRAHRAIGDALQERAGDGPEAPAAEIAHHLLAAEPANPAEALRAAGWGRVAAERATAGLAFEEAARHYQRALGALTAGAQGRLRGELLVALGDAHDRAGAPGRARAAFAAAAGAARAAADPALLAVAALGHGGLVTFVGEPDPERVALLEEALGALGDRAPALRPRLLARLAIEVYYADDARADSLSAEAVAAARALGDPRALADALNARRVAVWSPARLPDRLAASEEMIAVAEAAGLRESALQGRNWRVLDLMELGRVADAEREVDAYARAADAVALPHHRWYVPLWRAALALLRGRWEEAAGHTASALLLGRRAEDPNVEIFVCIQVLQAQVEQGRFRELDTEPLRAFMPTSRARRPAWLAWEALLAAESGRRDEAQRILDELTGEELEILARGPNWHALCDAAEAAAAMGDRRVAGLVERLLRPYAHLAPAIARGIACYGSLEYFQGRLAATLGDLPRGRAHLERAVVANLAMGAVPRAELARRRLVELGGGRR